MAVVLLYTKLRVARKEKPPSHQPGAHPIYAGRKDGLKTMSTGVQPHCRLHFRKGLSCNADICRREGYAWSEDKEHCEEYGRLLNAGSFFPVSRGDAAQKRSNQAQHPVDEGISHCQNA